MFETVNLQSHYEENIDGPNLSPRSSDHHRINFVARRKLHPDVASHQDDNSSRSCNLPDPVAPTNVCR